MRVDGTFLRGMPLCTVVRFESIKSKNDFLCSKAAQTLSIIVRVRAFKSWAGDNIFPCELLPFRFGRMLLVLAVKGTPSALDGTGVCC
jgi:hypothetical protein